MSETIQVGGVGKSPAIEKMNRINALNSRINAAAKLEKKAFDTADEKAKEQLKKRMQIIKDYSIDFSVGGPENETLV